MRDLDQCHFIGIGGVGMSGLAKILHKKNVRVSGSDMNSNYVTEKLTNEGVSVKIGHSAEHVSQDMTVVYTTGVDEVNPEYTAALHYQCKMMHRSDLLQSLMEGHKALTVAGTHGKTTTSSLLASVLMLGGLDPTFAIGGILPEFGTNAHKGEGEFFVAEACESDGTFVKYLPFGAIITNVDLDHMDFFKNEANLIQSFQEFSKRIISDEHFFWCGDDHRLKTLGLEGNSYGFNSDCTLKIKDEKQDGWTSTFDIEFKGVLYKTITLSLTGKHNVLNAAAVFGLCLSLGVSEEIIRMAFDEFKGVNRRCEKKGEAGSVLVIDDYAHHPTEITATLQGIRKGIGNRKLIALFQPHRYTRTKDCLGSFAYCFKDADEVIVTDIYAAQEMPIPGIHSQLVVDELKAHFHGAVSYIPRDALLEHCLKTSRPHDVIVTMGAGDITQLGPQIIHKMDNCPPKKWRVGVVFGGKSMEHEISLLSAEYVIDSLDRNLYEVELFGIQKTGKWQICSQGTAELSLKEDTGPIFTKEVVDALLKCDLFFPILHGPYGEDGTLQGFFDVLGKAYVGCDHRSSAISMDKDLTKKLAALNGIPVVPSLTISQHEWKRDHQILRRRIHEELRYPVFIKPLHLGSTVGISKVNDEADLDVAIEKALKLDTDILVENGLTIREIEFAVMGNDCPVTFAPGEILTDGRVYDYAGKYGKEAPIMAVPEAELSDSIKEQGKELAKRAYLAVGCKGMARVDFFLDEKDQLWLNEINPIPGFTKNSLYPQICAANGISGDQLISQLIILALERKRHIENTLENIA